ncbi:MAG: hypothetical protein RLZZ327_1181 [Actinomycetota bacterium]|jgi:molybdopterin synthase catalytic subunit
MTGDRIEVSDTPLDVAELYEWALSPECGAVVVFSGTVRNHAEGRSGVTSLTYEAYREAATTKLQDVVDEARRRYPTLGRVALVHRLGELDLTESSVVVVVSAPHRPEAFDAARYCIDALKQSVPIWKKETWSNGTDWGTGAVNPIPASSVGDASARSAS